MLLLLVGLQSDIVRFYFRQELVCGMDVELPGAGGGDAVSTVFSCPCDLGDLIPNDAASSSLKPSSAISSGVISSNPSNSSSDSLLGSSSAGAGASSAAFGDTQIPRSAASSSL